jgi:hypothetical protein
MGMGFACVLRETSLGMIHALVKPQVILKTASLNRIVMNSVTLRLQTREGDSRIRQVCATCLPAQPTLNILGIFFFFLGGGNEFIFIVFWCSCFLVVPTFFLFLIF